ncbi:MAG: acyl carrier protein [Fimbriimonadaceae bacterium]|nr:acyl carrier protein [Fimbriimonadaceae bacterium]
MSAELKSEIKQMIVERLFLDRKGVKPTDIEDGANLMETLGVDSVELFEIVVGVEEDYGVALAEDEFSIERYLTVASIATLIGENQ